jgi:hypothetical protein
MNGTLRYGPVDSIHAMCMAAREQVRADCRAARARLGIETWEPRRWTAELEEASDG